MPKSTDFLGPMKGVAWRLLGAATLHQGPDVWALRKFGPILSRWFEIERLARPKNAGMLDAQIQRFLGSDDGGRVALARRRHAPPRTRRLGASKIRANLEPLVRNREAYPTQEGRDSACPKSGDFLGPMKGAAWHLLGAATLHQGPDVWALRKFGPILSRWFEIERLAAGLLRRSRPRCVTPANDVSTAPDHGWPIRARSPMWSEARAGYPFPTL